MKKKIISPKICFVCSSFHPAFVYGGPTFSNYQLAKKLSENGLSIQVVTTNANGEEKLNVDTNQNIQETNTFSIRYFDETIIGRFSLALFNSIKEFIQDTLLIHATDPFSTTFLIALLKTRKTSQKLILSTRGTFAEWGLQNKSVLKKTWLSLFIKPNLSRIIFHSTSEKEKKDIQALFPKAKVFVIPNGIEIIDSERIKVARNKFPEWLKSRGIESKNGTQYICSLGRIHAKKGFDILIKAYAIAQENFPNTQLLIAGNDEGQLTNLKSLVEKLGLKNKICFLGHLDDENKSILLAGSDLFALSSHNENFGNVYLEALNFGTPIIATKNTPWEAVEDYQCGLWINNSVEETAQAIMKLLQVDFSDYSRNARQLANEFSFEKTILSMKKNYFEILGINDTR